MDIKNKPDSYDYELYRDGKSLASKPCCSGLNICEHTSLAYLYPHIAKEWHYEKNGDLSPNKLSPGTKKKVWWICSNDNSHIFHSISIIVSMSVHLVLYVKGKLKVKY